MERVPDENRPPTDAQLEAFGYNTKGFDSDGEPTADFFAKEFTIDENIKLAQICFKIQCITLINTCTMQP